MAGAAIRQEPPPRDLARTAELLGGARVLTHVPTSPIEAHDLVERGLPGRALDHLWKVLSEHDATGVFESGVGMSVRTLQRLRKKPGGRLDRAQSGRAWQFVRILVRAADVLGSLDEAQRWLETPALGLEGRRPIDLLSTPDGVEMVETLLLRMDYGVYT